MLSFYKKALLSSVSLLLITLALGYLTIELTFLHEVVLPVKNNDPAFKWRSQIHTDVSEGGESSIEIIDDSFSYNFNMNVSSAVDYSFALAEIAFVGADNKQTSVSLKKFNTVNFRAKCVPENILTFAIYTVDENVTQFDDKRSYRISTRYFSCEQYWQDYEIDLTRLETPEWWYKFYNHELSKQQYSLDKVVMLSFGSSIQSPRDNRTNVNINHLELSGRDWQYMYVFAIFTVVTWVILAVWLFREYTRSLLRYVRNKVQKDRPLVAYQQLSLEPQKDKDKTAILRYMATEYANPDLNLEVVVKNLGVNRNKINDILKRELGYTFSAYLNKLRLNEAARLLAENETANVSEIAYSVGYKNVPYFNKLFKGEYGCSPKMFKTAYKEGDSIGDPIGDP